MNLLNVPVNTRPDEEPRIEYVQTEGFNSFGGVDSRHQQVLQSAAGFYVGMLYHDEEMGGWFPYSRDSARYWKVREEAEEALLSGNFMPKF
jgi:hypothetical protein